MTVDETFMWRHWKSVTKKVPDFLCTCSILQYDSGSIVMKLLYTRFPVYAINVSIVKTIQPGCLILLHSLGPIMLPSCQILVALSVVSFMYQRYVKLLSTTVTIPNGKCLHLTQILDHQLPLNQSSGGSCLLEFSSCTMPSHKILTI